MIPKKLEDQIKECQDSERELFVVLKGINYRIVDRAGRIAKNANGTPYDKGGIANFKEIVARCGEANERRKRKRNVD